MSDSFDFEEYRKIELRIRELSKKIEVHEKERDEVNRRKRIEPIFSDYI